MNAKRRPGRGAENAAGRAEGQHSPEAALAVLGALEGVEVPGGCDHCDAHQVLTDLGDRVWNLRTWHEAGCLRYQSSRASQS